VEGDNRGHKGKGGKGALNQQKRYLSPEQKYRGKDVWEELRWERMLERLTKGGIQGKKERGKKIGNGSTLCGGYKTKDNQGAGGNRVGWRKGTIVRDRRAKERKCKTW